MVVRAEQAGNEFFLPVVATHQIEVTGPPQPARLAIQREGDSVVVTLEGLVGQTYDLEQTATLSPPGWATARSVTLTNSLERIVLPLEAEVMRFWRAKSR